MRNAKSLSLPLKLLFVLSARDAVKTLRLQGETIMMIHHISIPANNPLHVAQI